MPTLVKHCENSFVISLYFPLISFLVFIAFGREQDFFFCFPVVSLITCHVFLASIYIYLAGKHSSLFYFILSFS